MNLSLESIAITKMGNSAGVFIGKTNTLNQFHCEKIRNEVIGAISGNENKLDHSRWLKTKTREG